MNDAKVPRIDTELTDGRLRLRPWQDGDAAALCAAVHESTASVGRWLPWCRAEYGSDDAVAWVEQCRRGWRAGEHFAFPVFDAGSGRLLGGAGLSQHDPRHRRANLGYWVRQSSQRQGVAAAAARLVAHFGFEQLGLIRIEIVVLEQNQESRATAERLGAKAEALARHRLQVDGQARDALVYGLIRSDLA